MYAYTCIVPVKERGFFGFSINNQELYAGWFFTIFALLSNTSTWVNSLQGLNEF